MNLTFPNNILAVPPNDRSKISFQDRDTHPPQARPTPTRQVETFKGARHLRLGHVHLKVRDLTRALPFYLGLLGLRLTERVGRYAFLSIGSEHHSLALEEIGVGATHARRHAVGVAHFAFEVPDRDGFVAMRRTLSAAKVPFISRNNGISWTVRFKDPDGNEIEVFVDRRRSPGGAARWDGRWHGPLSAERTTAKALPVAA